MTRRVRFWIWCSFAVTLLLVLTVAAITPLIVDKSGLRQHIAKELTHWSGGRLTIRGPISLSYYPEIQITARNVLLVPGERFPALADLYTQRMAVTVRWADILTGQSSPRKIVLDEPRFRLRPPAQSPAATGDGTVASKGPPPLLLLDRLASAPFSMLKIRDGRIVAHDEERPDADLARVLRADLSFNASRQLANLKTSFDWRDETATLVASLGVQPDATGSPPRPISATLTSRLLTFRVKGRTAERKGFQIRGESAVASPDLRALAGWLGYQITGRAGLRGFSAEGTAALARKRVVFDAATIRLDGNEAQGAIAFSINDGRPMAQGTLAFDKLSLQPYLGLGTHANALALRTQPSDTPLFDPTVLRSFDLDLRLSAGELLVVGLDIGRIGTTISLRDGQFNAEFVEADLFDGRATGHIGVDASAETPRSAAAITFRDVDLNRGLSTLFGVAPLSGKGDIGIDLASSGRSIKSVRSLLEGTVTTSLTEAGVLAIDLPSLIAAARKAPLSGWPRSSGESKLENLEFKAQLKQGTAYGQAIRFRTAGRRAEGGGIIDLPERRLNLMLEVIDTPANASSGDSPSDTLSIEGPFSAPIIRLLPQPTEPGETQNELDGFAAGSTN